MQVELQHNNGTNGSSQAAASSNANGSGRSLTKFWVSSDNEEFEIDLQEIFANGYIQGEIDGLVALFSETGLQLEPFSCVTLFLWHQLLKIPEAMEFAARGVSMFKKAAQTNSQKAHGAVLLLNLQVSMLLEMARQSIVLPLDGVRQDVFADKRTRGEHLSRAHELASDAYALAADDINATEAQIVVLMAQEKYDVATHFCKLARERDGPASIVATLAQARIFIHENNFRGALREYQQVLRYAPRATPDPRVGIGYCLWRLGHRVKARQAWERSCAVNPGPASAAAHLYLGLAHFNDSRNAHELEENRLVNYRRAIQEHLQPCFKTSKFNASVSVCLSHQMLITGKIPTAVKLAERAVQCATDDAVRAEAHFALARALHAQGEVKDAMVHYILTVKHRDDFDSARVAAAHLLMLQGDVTNAQVSLERLIKKSPDFVEALVALAAIHAHIAFNTKSTTEAGERRQSAMKLYDQVLRMFTAQNARDSAPSAIKHMLDRIQFAANDADLFIEVGRLWAVSDPNKALKAFQSAISIRKDLETAPPPQLFNNVGCLLFYKKQSEQALEAFQEAAQAAISLDDESRKDAVLTTTAYNMTVIQELQGQVEEASTTLKRILSRHPEWTDAKARLSMMLIARREFDQAHEMLKEALTSRGKDLEIRALYTYFLIKIGNLTTARDFAHATTKIDKSTSADLYANAAIAYILYTQAREAKPQSAEEAKKRNAKFIQSVEYYERALRHDSQCAFAAQGLAIALAEGAMGPFGSNMTDALRLKNLRDALSILNKVRETVNDGSVYVNIGHCHASRDEWDRAVEAYETASKRFYQGQNIACLIYLSRAWYQKASKDQSFDAVRAALKASQQALELNPADDTIRYNIAMIGHKGLEVITELSPGQRSSDQIVEAIQYAEEAQSIFENLGSNVSGQPTPYNVDIASQRARFGTTMVNKVKDEVLNVQREHENTEQGKLDSARRAREEDRRQKQASEDRRMQALRERNERLAEERKAMQQDSQQWYTKMVGESDVEEEVGTKKRKKGKGPRKSAPKDGDNFVVEDEAAVPAEGGADEGEEVEEEGEKLPTTRPKPTRRKSTKKAKDESAEPDGDEGGAAAGPKRSRAVVQGSDDEDGKAAVNSSKRQKKNPISAEFIDSDEDE